MKIGFVISGLSLLLILSCSPSTEKVSLFNGVDLTGWVAVVDTASSVSASEVFTVKDGMINVTGQPFGYLRTEKKYGDYTLHVEWRWIGEATNSGIFQRVQDGDKVWPAAIECQLHAGDAGDFVCLGGARIPEVDAPPQVEFPVKERNSTDSDIEKAAGEWNTAEIVCVGTNIKVFINGSFENECTAPAETGYIALQSEGGPLEFRNIYLQPGMPQ